MNHWLRVVSGLSVLCLTGCSEPAPEPAPAASVPATVTEGFVQTSDGVQLFYRTVGKARDTLVVIHGGPGLTLDYFAADLEPLAQHHTLIFYDQRGAGRSTLVSDSSALDARRFAEDLEALRSHFGMERLNLMGHSWGAAVAALYAQQYPERIGRLLIVAGVPPRATLLTKAFQDLDARRDSSTRRQMQQWREARLANPGDAEACRAYYVLWFVPFFGDSTAAARSQGDFCAGTAESRRNKMASVDRYTTASLGEWDWRAALRSLDAPVLVIHGSVDVLPLEGAREWALALPNSRLLVFNRTGHFPYLEDPERFFAAVRQFLRGQWPEDSEAISAS